MLEAFKALDQDKCGGLTVGEAAQLCLKILPFTPSPAQISYFKLMLDPSSKRVFTFQQLKDAMEECRAVGFQVREPFNFEASTVLQRIASTLQQRALEVQKLFHEMDKTSSGELAFPDWVRPG